MTYRPDPIDTSGVRLDPSLDELTEFLARNTHEVWAKGRVGEGWTYAPEPDPAARHHPSLVPYHELPEGEKQYDRETAIQTLKLIASLGYRIVPPAGQAAGTAGAPPPDPGPAGVAQGGVDPKRLGVGQIIALWQAWDETERQGPPSLYAGVAERALKLGEPLLAFDILKAALKHFPADVRLRQLHGLALSRSGVVEEATAALQALRDEGHDDEETLGNLARTLKDRWEAAPNGAAAAAGPGGAAEKRRLLEQAFAGYESAYRHPKGGYWTGINAATLAACLGRHDRADALAAEVEAECRRRLEALPEDDAYWELATLGEAALVRRRLDEAAAWYGRAARVAGEQYGNVGSTRRNAALLLRVHGADASLADRWLPMPRVVVFAGHMIDRPGRPEPRFPPPLEPALAAEIRARVEALDVRYGYASAACGSDILFLEAVAARGGEVNVVLPYELDRFIRDSVNLDPAGGWEARLRALLARDRTRLTVASQGNVHAVGVANAYANQFTFGLAGIRAFQMRTELAALAAWDGGPGDGAGGTADAVARWRAAGVEPMVIDLAALRARERPDPAARVPSGAAAGAGRASPTIPPASPPPPGVTGTHMMALLFADVVGFSRLTEDELPLFVEHFLRPVAEMCDPARGAGAGGPVPVQRNTWGDGLYFVFRTVADAGRFALELRDRVTSTDWVALGFRGQIGMRTGLHVGPVYRCVNPVTGREDYLGTHVSRAARIEPITPKGQVYASEVFAAIAFAERVGAFTCDYVGQIGLAKEYGTYPTYHVRRRG
jgi:class 3 adenylate cyclase